MKYYIGIDGGGTKTAYALFDETRQMLCTCKTAGSNHENLAGSYDEAVEIIMGGINELLRKAGLELDAVEGILMGLAGIDHTFQHDAMCERFIKKGLKDFLIYNDGYIIVMAGAPGCVGIAYNCGTGTCCNSIDDNGNMLQIGGFGAMSGDAGNGYWIAEKTLAAVYTDVVLKSTKTLMTGFLCDNSDISPEPEDVIGIIPEFDEGDERDNWCRRLTDSFFEALNAGDGPALAIAEEMAERGADFIAAHVKRQHFRHDPVHVVLSGAMNVKMPNQIYLRLLQERCIAKTGRHLSFIKLTAPPVTGCINRLLEIENNREG